MGNQEAVEPNVAVVTVASNVEDVAPNVEVVAKNVKVVAKNVEVQPEALCARS
jgi:hypothetical protein